MRKDAFYFPHDSNAKDDPKCVMLIEQLGCEGYGIYWILVEILREQPDYCCPLSLLAPFARRYNTTFEKMKTVVMSYGLFTITDDKIFFSESLMDRMLPLEDKREKNRLAGKASAEKRALAQQTFNTCSTDVQQVFNLKEKSIEEKKREDNNKESTNVDKKNAAKAATLTRKDGFYKSLVPFVDKYPKDMIRAFFDYWSEMNKSETKMRFEKQPTWEVGKRLATWANKETFNGKSNRTKTNSDSTERKQSVRNLADLSEAILQGAVAKNS